MRTAFQSGMLSRDKLISFYSTIIRYRTALTDLR
jgi:hypothetical protein